ncbi:hypothetical protein VNO80_10119 [Phaseolus coccineus]|uniref:Uncharacterized protein n=1 Tax=Phaseolus coccineus TaxID=3886 RepID=A0AAN9N805_PHACN
MYEISTLHTDRHIRRYQSVDPKVVKFVDDAEIGPVVGLRPTSVLIDDSEHQEGEIASLSIEVIGIDDSIGHLPPHLLRGVF